MRTRLEDIVILCRRAEARLGSSIGATDAARISRLFTLGHRIALVDPVRAEVASHVHHLEVGVAERVQQLIGGMDVGALTPGAASTVENNRCVLGQRLHALTKLLLSSIAGAGSHVLSPGDVGLEVECVWADVKDERLLPSGL